MGFFWISISSTRAQEAKILEIENKVLSSRKEKRQWNTAKLGELLAIADKVRTERKGRAMVRISELYTMRMDHYTTVEMTPRLVRSSKPTLNISRGITFIFSREKESEIDVKTPTANAALRGTQLVVEVGENGKTSIAVIEGEVDLSNELGAVRLLAGESGEAVRGQAPRRTAVIQARNLVQWALYYPGILEFEGLSSKRLEASLAAYRQGDLPRALELLPENPGQTAEEILYHAQVLLAVGRVDESKNLLKRVANTDSRKRALLRLIAAVTLVPVDGRGLERKIDLRIEGEPQFGRRGELALAESYYQQATHNLKEAREQARLAVQLSPRNGFAWTRLAELEFSFGENDRADVALQNGLRLTPRNAQAHSLRGFILAGQNRTAKALQSFETALAIDGALGNAWLGRGLCKIKNGQLAEGRDDLQAAATVEPTQALFHSYLGKAFGELGEGRLAEKDFDLARRLDPNDPTPLLYSAIENQRQNQPNKGIRDLNESIRLNDNRRVYRSRLLLDQDRAVRGANLARIYQNAGMTQVAVREATRAVEADYTSSAAHLFLANSFDALRDPRRVSLRYETPWFNELLLANLFAPVGGGPLSQFVSQQEYSKLFNSDGLGASLQGQWQSDDEYFSRLSVFGVERNLEFGIDINYRNARGIRENNASDLLEIYAQAKWQATPDDTFYFLGKWQDQTSGDNFQTFDNRPLEPLVEFEEKQDPGLLLGGWNHRWAPGVHTLLLGGRLSTEQTLRNPQSQQLKVVRSANPLSPGFFQVGATGFQFTDPALNAERQAAIANGDPVPGQIGPDGESLNYSPALLGAIQPFLGQGAVLGLASTANDASSFDLVTHRELEVYSADLQQIFQGEKNTLLFGGRIQSGEIRARSRLSHNKPPFNFDGFGSPASEDSFSYDFTRFNAYLYDYFTPFEGLTLIGGASWDRLDRPENFRNPPLSGENTTEERISGKGGFTYTAGSAFTMRGMYSEGLGGVSFDESVRLEPVQIAGFNQSFRTALSESVAGSVEAPEFETWGLSVEGVLPTNTWWGVSVAGISQSVERQRGIFTGYQIPVLFQSLPAFFPDQTQENLDYEELQITATLNQLIGDQFAIGALYRVTDSKLTSGLPDLDLETEQEALLHEVSLFADWNSPTGLFGRIETNWYQQELDGLQDGAGNSLDGDSFFQSNATLGYRFRNNEAEVRLSVLNLFDEDYQLHPLSPYLELPRERTFVASVRWNF